MSIELSDEQERLALHAVRDLIARRTLCNNPVPPGMYRLCHDLQGASARGSKDEAGQPQWNPEELIDSAETAAILQCSARWVTQIHSDLEGRNISGRWVFRRQTVVDYAHQKDGAR